MERDNCRAIFYCGDLDNKVVGFGSLATDGYLDFMFVHKDYQGQGIANRLLSELEKKAIKQDNQVIYSEVSITAKKFFENHGFVVKQKQLKKSRDKELENYNMTKNVRWQLTTDDINAEHPTCGLL